MYDVISLNFINIVLKVSSDCVNLCNGFECVCYDGYEMVHEECLEICQDSTDHCLTNPCSETAICNSECGSYTCECAEGYVQQNHLS